VERAGWGVILADVNALVLTFPDPDPVALRIGPLAVHWYGVMYLLAFVIGYRLLHRRLRHPPYVGDATSEPWPPGVVSDLMAYLVVGVVAGGRLGYCLFYKPLYYATHPLEIVALWDGGMSFHGGALGVAAAVWLFGRKRRRPFLLIADLLVPVVPVGLGLGRIGNFINGELWGRPADPSLPWAMVFPRVDAVPRHPSQLYEVLLEGALLFVLLWAYARRGRAPGEVSGAFLVGYGVFRFTAESFREPDDFLGLLSLGLSMGQWLCLPMIAGGAALWLWAHRRRGSKGAARGDKASLDTPGGMRNTPGGI
jgi:phosphatidylglycerol---prolipoprotein diacylglyceryl transferase